MKQKPKGERQTLLKKLESTIASGAAFSCSSSGYFDLSIHDELVEPLKHANDECARLLGINPANVVGGEFSSPEDHGSRFDPVLRLAKELFGIGLSRGSREVLKKYDEALRIIGHKQRPKDRMLAALFFQSANGRINVRRLARRFGTSDNQVKAVEKRLRRYCKRLELPVLPPGAPAKRSGKLKV